MLSLTHIHLKSPNPNTTAKWYVDMLGAEIVDESFPPKSRSHSVSIQLGDARININTNAPGEHMPSGPVGPHMGLEHFGFHTDDLAPLLAKLEANNVEIIEAMRPTRNGFTSLVMGPDNVMIELGQHSHEYQQKWGRK